MIKFWKEEYPEYAEAVVVELSPDQKRNKRQYHTATHDLRYFLLNPRFSQLFMSGKKK